MHVYRSVQHFKFPQINFGKETFQHKKCFMSTRPVRYFKRSKWLRRYFEPHRPGQPTFQPFNILNGEILLSGPQLSNIPKVCFAFESRPGQHFKRINYFLLASRPKTNNSNIQDIVKKQNPQTPEINFYPYRNPNISFSLFQNLIQPPTKMCQTPSKNHPQTD